MKNIKNINMLQINVIGRNKKCALSVKFVAFFFNRLSI